MPRTTAAVLEQAKLKLRECKYCDWGKVANAQTLAHHMRTTHPRSIYKKNTVERKPKLELTKNNTSGLDTFLDHPESALSRINNRINEEREKIVSAEFAITESRRKIEKLESLRNILVPTEKDEHRYDHRTE